MTTTPFQPGVVRDWITDVGLRAVVHMTPMGHHCGYVAVPPEHPEYGADYDSPAVTVHGGLTYGAAHLGVKSDLTVWWFGYDCAHYGDGYHPNSPMARVDSTGTFRDEAFCVQECEELARQLADLA